MGKGLTPNIDKAVAAKAVAAAVAASTGQVHIDHQAIGIKKGTFIPPLLFSWIDRSGVDSVFVPYCTNLQTLARRRRCARQAASIH